MSLWGTDHQPGMKPEDLDALKNIHKGLEESEPSVLQRVRSKLGELAIWIADEYHERMQSVPAKPRPYDWETDRRFMRSIGEKPRKPY